MTLTPSTVLDPGTPVQVGHERGNVVSHATRRDQHGNPITVHTIHFTEKFDRGFGPRGFWRKMRKPVSREVNYSFIKVL